MPFAFINDKKVLLKSAIYYNQHEETFTKFPHSFYLNIPPFQSNPLLRGKKRKGRLKTCFQTAFCCLSRTLQIALFTPNSRNPNTSFRLFRCGLQKTVRHTALLSFVLHIFPCAKTTLRCQYNRFV